jgi:protein involved in polysaccharide export with SLBB domain
MAFLGQVNGRGKTYPQLKQEILAVVRRAYPQSSPTLVLTGLGSFEVTVRGTVRSAGIFKADGLTRLSSILNSRLLSYSSDRSIGIERSDGTTLTADLFLFSRIADPTMNPYVRPGDIITVPRAERQVNISGSVYRPGTYTLLPTDTLTDLIERYAEGLLDDADPVNASIIRNNREQVKEFIDLSAGQEWNSHAVLNLDSYNIPSVNVRQAVFFIEGALRAERLTTTDSQDARLSAAGLEPWLRERKDFIPGTNLQEAVRQAYPLLAQQAALGEAYLVKADSNTRIPVNFIEMLLGEGGRDIKIAPYDRLVVPYRQFWVNVTGAVNQPGFIPFVEGRDPSYYIDVAGGVNRQAGSGAFELRTSGGDSKKRNDPVNPMDTIHVHQNNINSSLGPTLGTVAAVLGIVGSVITIVTKIIEVTTPDTQPSSNP